MVDDAVNSNDLHGRISGGMLRLDAAKSIKRGAAMEPRGIAADRLAGVTSSSSCMKEQRNSIKNSVNSAVTKRSRAPHHMRITVLISWIGILSIFFNAGLISKNDEVYNTTLKGRYLDEFGIESQRLNEELVLIGDWCGMCRWKHKRISCDERAEYLVSNYNMSIIAAKASLLDSCTYTAVGATNEEASNDVSSQNSSSPETKVSPQSANNNTLPPIESFCKKLGFGKIQWGPDICELFDYAIAGFAKCGTTSVGRWLDAHSDVISPEGEMSVLHKYPFVACNAMYKTVKEAELRGELDGTLIGYRNPHDIQWPSTVDFFRNTCPSTKLIVIVRHPVLWFESFYNYRIANEEWWSFGGKATANDMIESVSPNHVSVFSGAFHRYLAKLGKTSMSDTAERVLLSGTKQYDASDNENEMSHPLENPILLIEMSQLSDHNETRTDVLKRDVERFLGLKSPLGPIPHQNKATHPTILTEETKEGLVPINICDSEHNPARNELMHIAKNASTWIQNWFLKSPSVHASSREYMDELLHAWHKDPCLGINKISRAS